MSRPMGNVEGGVPPLEIPRVGFTQLMDLLLPASAFALVAFADLPRPCGHSPATTGTRSTPIAS